VEFTDKDGTMNSLRARNIDLSTFGKQSNWFLGWGIVLVVLGALAISAATFTTLLTIVLLGTVILLAGIIILLDTFIYWTGKWSGFALHFMMGLLYLGVGALMLTTPVLTSESITLLLGIFYVLVGASRTTSAVAMQLPRWKWALFNGIITLLLGILILSAWPASSLFIIGLFVGIDIFFCGWTFIMMSLAAKAMRRK